MNEAVFWLTIHPLTLISLIATLVVNWQFKLRRKLIGLTLLVYVVVLVVTQLYFLPELILFAHSPESTVPAADWLARGRRWQRFSWLRGTIMYAAYLPLLFALSKPADDLRFG